LLNTLEKEDEGLYMWFGRVDKKCVRNFEDDVSWRVITLKTKNGVGGYY
jgi:hypothetical protein